MLVLFVTGTACARGGEVTPSDFEVPNPTVEERQAILARYDYLDPQNIVPSAPLEAAVIYFDKNKSKIKNQNYLSVIDFAQASGKKRFYIINMSTGAVWNIHTAHGNGSDPDHDGFATKFSNNSGSNMTSLGFYMTGETYFGKHDLSLRLDGLSSTNSSARERAIVIHGAWYVEDRERIQGRSEGCPAVSLANSERVVNLLKNGSLIYASQIK
ncbi:MAG: murein L,D-transpeptidase catalytic domain family protein [Bdellovibrionaceae bacterium]|nr:murein L,D-transpeptidase catalytic domain family protein [Pseudobdellovibrionaceae bacterium]